MKDIERDKFEAILDKYTGLKIGIDRDLFFEALESIGLKVKDIRPIKTLILKFHSPYTIKGLTTIEFGEQLRAIYIEKITE